MFLFYDTKQNEKNSSYYKGLLFEDLLADLLNKLGYIIEIRKKYNSLEYDLEGIDRATDRKIFGEAKALEKNIAGQMLSAYVGKLMPLGLVEKNINGLFLSISPLTAEADSYYQSIKSFGVKCITGKDLFNTIVENLNLPKIENLKAANLSSEYELQSYFLLKTDIGLFIVLISGAPDSVVPTYFSLFNSNGQPITDESFYLKLSENISVLAALKSLYKAKPKKNIENIRTIPYGLSVGSSWTDYRLPAGPRYYVGRNDLISSILDHINTGSETNVLQIKSRSGVGKSSTLALLDEKLRAKGYNTEIHDSRDIKSVLDFKAIIRRFSDSGSTPQDMREVDELLEKYVESLKDNKAIFIVDQFESTFQKPDIFEAYETLANFFLKYPKNLFFCLARKNDQITTYDDSKISLERFNEISKHFGLKDFTQKEAALLIDNINKTSSISVGNDILSYVLEFAQGFPWLLKRTMAHIIKLIMDP